MGSTRFPGKVLHPVCGVPLIKRLYDRLSASKRVTHLLIAIPVLPEDNPLADFLKLNKIPFYRGSDWDVLSRFYHAATDLHPYKNDVVVRICADNPLLDAKVMDWVIDRYFENNVDYFSNSNKEPNFLEDGFDVEVFSFNALEIAFHEAKLLSQREHVTPYIKDSGKFRCAWKKVCPDYHFKLSLDTINDLKSIENIISALKDTPNFSIDDVVNVIKKDPGLIEPNKDAVINSGYHKSLENDKLL
jgi:spore coat polysaccharide biosynthesis protein SpsF (cytidylyltransferase family)